MSVKFSNNATTELASSIGTSDTSITVVDASKFPILTAGDYTYVTLDTDTASPTREIVKVTAISGNVLTVTRGMDGTSPASFAAGTKVELRLTAALLNDVAGANPSGEPIGFPDKSQTTITFDSGTRTFSITPTGASFDVYCKGIKYTYTAVQLVTIPNTTGLHFIYFSASGVLSTQMSYFTWEEHAPTAYVYWNATTQQAIYFADERHGITLDWQTHEYLHRTRGAAIANGFAASGYTTTGLGATDADAQIDIGGGTFFDEDMQVDIVSTNTPVAGTWQQDLSGPARIPVLYLSGSAWVIDAPTNFPFKVVSSVPQYNLYSGGTWSTASVTNNSYFVSWILATNNLTYPVVSIISQAPTNQVSVAEAMTFEGLNLNGFPSVEFRPLYKVIYQYKDGFANSVKSSTIAVYDLRSISSAGVAAALVQDHGNLSGLTDDDHPQYVHTSEVRTPSAAVKNSFFPSQVGQTGKYLSTDGTNTVWEPAPSGSLSFTGDVTGTGSTGSSVSLTLAASGVVAGQYTKVTVDAKGRVTAGTSVTSSDVTTALGYTPYNATNPAGYTTNVGTVTSVSGTGTVSGLTLTGSVTSSGSLTLGGTLSLTSGQVTSALGFTPYNATNPSGYITSSALSSYLPLSGGTLTGDVGIGAGFNGFNSISGTERTLYVANGNAASLYLHATTGSGRKYALFSSASGALAIYDVNAGAYRLQLDTSAANFSVALQQSGNQVLHAGNYNDYAPSKTGTGASGTWSINITGNANSLDGYDSNAFSAQNSVLSASDFQYGAISLSTNSGFSLSGLTTDTDQHGRYYYYGAGQIATRYIPVDKNGLYRMKIRWKASAASGTYIAVFLLDTNGNNINGAGTYWAYPWSGASSPTSWTENEYWYFGSQMPSNAAYVAFGISHTNYGGGSATYYVSQLEIQRVQTSVNGSAILHAGNYSGYALPIGGGTLTGNVTTSHTGTLSTFNGRTFLRTTATGDSEIGGGAGSGYTSIFVTNAEAARFTSSALSINGSRPIQISSSDGAMFVTASAGGWSMGTYFKGNSGTIRAGFGALGSNNDLTYAWIGTGYDGAWMTLTPSSIAVNTDFQLGSNYLRFDQSGVRSWNMRATGGNLDLNSGDGNGSFRYNGNSIFTAAGGVLSGAIRAPQITAGGSNSTDANLGVQGTSHLTGQIYYGGTVGNVNSWSSTSTSVSGVHTFSASQFIFNRYGYGSQPLIDMQSSSITFGQPAYAGSGITVNNAAGDGRGINLYSGSPTSPTYGLFFATTGNFGTYGAVSGDWATYFTMSSDSGRGWVFRNGSGNVAAISNQGNMTLNSHFEQGNNIARPNVSWSAGGGSTGMVIFYLPGTTGNYGMVHMVFDIYEYNSNSVSTVIVGGHNWSTSWYNVGANVIGTCAKEVRLGVKNGRFCVVFGTAGSSWEYGTIVLRKIHNGSFYDNVMNMVGDWESAQTTTESFTNITGDLRALRTPASLTAGGVILSGSGFRSNRWMDYDGNFLFRQGTGSGVTRHLNLADSENDPSDVVTFSGISWGQRSDGNPYYMIYTRKYDRGGGLGNYTRLQLAWHTGIDIGSTYGGTRFYNNSPWAGSEIFSVGNGDSNVRVVNTLYSYAYRGNGNVAGTGEATYHPAGIYSTSTNWLYGTMYRNGSDTYSEGGSIYSTNQIVCSQNYGRGLNGVYDSYRFQHVWMMGTSYQLAADGTTTGNAYGIAWSHPNAGGVAGNLDSHGMLILINGGFASSMSYSIRASGNVTAYSDERLKTNWREMPENYVERLAQVKVGIYDRIDGEKITQVGIGAQSFQRLLPEAITKATDEMGTLSVSYGNAAMASAVELAKELVMLKKELAEIKSRLH